VIKEKKKKKKKAVIEISLLEGQQDRTEKKSGRGTSAAKFPPPGSYRITKKPEVFEEERGTTGN